MNAAIQRFTEKEGDHSTFFSILAKQHMNQAACKLQSKYCLGVLYESFRLFGCHRKAPHPCENPQHSYPNNFFRFSVSLFRQPPSDQTSPFHNSSHRKRISMIIIKKRSEWIFAICLRFVQIWLSNDVRIHPKRLNIIHFSLSAKTQSRSFHTDQTLCTKQRKESSKASTTLSLMIPLVHPTDYFGPRKLNNAETGKWRCGCGDEREARLI